MILLIDASRSLLLLIDLQSKLVPAIASVEKCLDHAGLLIEAARRLEIPIRASEHCAAQIGPTVPPLRQALDDGDVLAKTHFDASAEPAFRANLDELNRPTIVVLGVEAHVCVLQTVLGLKARGYHPVLVADAISSRTLMSRDAAIDRMRQNGVEILTTEMVIFEWLRAAETPAFKALLPMIKAGKPIPP